MITINYVPNKINSITDYNTVYQSGKIKEKNPVINFEYCKIEPGFKIIKIDIKASEQIRCIQEAEEANRAVVVCFWISQLAIINDLDESRSNYPIHKEGVHFCNSNYSLKFESSGKKNAKGYMLVMDKTWLKKKILNMKVLDFFMNRGSRIESWPITLSSWKNINIPFDENAKNQFSQEWQLTIVGWTLLGNLCSNI